MSDRQQQAIVVGAGFSGLTAAFRLQQAGWQVTVLEACDNVGGRVQSIEKNGYLIDTGASALFEGYDAYMELARDIGLDGDIVPSPGLVSTLRDGREHQMDLTRPLRSALLTPLISWRSKLKMANLLLDVFRLRHLLDHRDLSKAADHDDETVLEYCRRRLNNEIYEYLANPMVRGLVIANGDRVSKLELLSGFRNIFNGHLCNLLGGLNRFPQELRKRLDVSVSTPVIEVRQVGEGVEVVSRGADGDTETHRADACVIATPMQVSHDICPTLRPLLAPICRQQQYSKSVVVQIGTRPAPPCEAHVIQVPQSEYAEMALLMVEHLKAPDRAPAGHGLISAMWLDEAGQRYWHESDEHIVARTIAMLEKFWPGIGATVDMTHVARWNEIVPLVGRGGFKVQRELKQRLDRRGRIQLAGDFLSTGGQNVAVIYGNRAARNLIEAFPD